MHGEFLVNGEWIPNTFTTKGMQAMLKSAFQALSPDWYCGLCSQNPGDVLALGDMYEPAIGVGGYARQALPLTLINWPTIGAINGESYIETRLLTFPYAGGYSAPVSRLFLTDGTDVMAVSSMFPAGSTVIVAPFATKYRLFGR